MGSVRFGMVADALSEGLGLFTVKKATEEKERVERQWQQALVDQRERNSMAREKRGYAHTENIRAIDQEAATEQRVADDARQSERDRLTAEDRNANREQSGEQFDLKRTDAAEESLFKRIDAARKLAADQIEDAKAMLDETAEERITAAFMQERDEMIAGHVLRLGQRGAPGYDLKQAGDLESKFIELGMSTNAATERTVELQDVLWPQPITGATRTPTGVPLAGGQPGGPQAAPDLIPAPQAPQSPQVANTAAAGSRPVDMLGDTATSPGSPVVDFLNMPATDLFPAMGRGIKKVPGAVSDFMNKEVPYGQ